MNLVLKKLSRSEIIAQVENCLKTLDHTKSKIVIPFRSGTKNTVVKIHEDARGVFLQPFESGHGLLQFAPLFHSPIHEHTAEELVERLRLCTSEDVWIQWPKDGPTTCIGNILSVAVENVLTVILYPVPKDIARINEEVRAICARKCKSVALGLQCGECEAVGSCPILADADKEITQKQEGETK